MQTASVYTASEVEAQRYMWIESEKAGYDLGEMAIRRWVQVHWNGFLRVRWMEHLQGKRFWIELDRGDFGLLQREFHDNALLLDRIVDRLLAGKDNLDIILWAIEWGIPMDSVIKILESLDINSRRLCHSFTSLAGDVPIVSLDPAWLAWQGGTIRYLAHSIGEEKAFECLGILGDALEDAGCTDPVILAHCRTAGKDIAWSWLVDLIRWSA
jgi:hypothetical protein